MVLTIGIFSGFRSPKQYLETPIILCMLVNHDESPKNCWFHPHRLAALLWIPLLNCLLQILLPQKKERKDNIKTQQEIVPKNRTWQWKIWWKIRHLVPKPPCIGYRLVPHATYVKMYTTYTILYLEVHPSEGVITALSAVGFFTPLRNGITTLRRDSWVFSIYTVSKGAGL